jgi:hypothetical protein
MLGVRREGVIEAGRGWSSYVASAEAWSRKESDRLRPHPQWNPRTKVST